MERILFWATNNWFLLVQGTGIVGSLLFTAISLRKGTKARKISDVLTLNREHRELWGEARRRPELARVSSSVVDLIASPITEEEEEFLNQVFVHYNSGWLLARTGSLLTLETLARDVVVFFSLPIPKHVWEQTRHARDRRFVAFVDKALTLKKK